MSHRGNCHENSTNLEIRHIEETKHTVFPMYSLSLITNLYSLTLLIFFSVDLCEFKLLNNLTSQLNKQKIV